MIRFNTQELSLSLYDEVLSLIGVTQEIYLYSDMAPEIEAFQRRHGFSRETIQASRLLEFSAMDLTTTAERKAIQEISIYTRALQFLHPHMVRWLSDTNAMITLTDPRTIQRISIAGESLMGLNTTEAATALGVTVMYPDKQKTIVFVPDVQSTLRADYTPEFVLAHEIGHHFQWFTHDREWKVLDALRPSTDYPLVEWYADLFGYFFTNSPPGVRKKHVLGAAMVSLTNRQLEELDHVIRRLYNDARNSKTYAGFLARVGAEVGGL